MVFVFEGCIPLFTEMISSPCPLTCLIPSLTVLGVQGCHSTLPQVPDAWTIIRPLSVIPVASFYHIQQNRFSLFLPFLSESLCHSHSVLLISASESHFRGFMKLVPLQAWHHTIKRRWLDLLEPKCEIGTFVCNANLCVYVSNWERSEMEISIRMWTCIPDCCLFLDTFPVWPLW